MSVSRDSIRRRLAELNDLALEVHASRPDLQQAFPDPLGGASEKVFLDGGASAFRLINRLTAEADRRLTELSSVLGFGCGCGRVLRYFLRHAHRIDCTGTDVDANMIEWDRGNFPFGEFVVQRPTPPLAIDDGRFDLIYAISFFSHLTEADHLAWLRELRRLLRPNGLLIATVHGRHALCAASTEAQKLAVLQVSRADLQTAANSLDDRHYAFIKQRSSHLDPNHYGITFLDDAYVARRWSELFDVV